MKPFYLAVALAVLAPCYVTMPTAWADPITFIDNFNDGNADGWWLGNSLKEPWVNGNWRVENGVLVNDQGGDGFLALVDNLSVSSQSIATSVSLNGPSGWGGVVLWYQDPFNWVTVTMYPVGLGLGVSESINGVGYGFQDWLSYSNNEWYDLTVKTDSTNGTITVFLNDAYMFTYNVTTTNRFGRSGVVTGNAGAYFDDFSITGVPEPSTLTLLGLGMAGLIGFDCKRRFRRAACDRGTVVKR